MQCTLGGRKAVRAALAALTLAASAACSDSATDKASPTATVATEPAPTTTADPYAVPTVIDAAYVNKVLAGLDAAVGDVTRLVVRTRTIPREAHDRLRAIYADEDFLQIQIDNYQADMRKEFVGYKPVPGNKSTAVNRLISGKASCIFAEAQREYSAVGTNTSNAPHPVWVALMPLDQTRDPSRYNPTQWAYVYDGFPPDRSQPPDPCVA